MKQSTSSFECCRIFRIAGQAQKRANVMIIIWRKTTLNKEKKNLPGNNFVFDFLWGGGGRERAPTLVHPCGRPCIQHNIRGITVEVNLLTPFRSSSNSSFFTNVCDIICNNVYSTNIARTSIIHTNVIKSTQYVCMNSCVYVCVGWGSVPYCIYMYII